MGKTTTITKSSKLTKTTSAGNRGNFVPNACEGCKKGAEHGYKNNARNITDLFLDGEDPKPRFEGHFRSDQVLGYSHHKGFVATGGQGCHRRRKRKLLAPHSPLRPRRRRRPPP